MNNNYSEKFEKMRLAGKLAAKTLDMITDYVKPGITTNKIDQLCFEYIKDNFSYVFESSKLRMRKPERKIYLYVLNKLKVNAKEILFIDDLGINLKPAKELGFHTHKFVDTNKTIKYIMSLLDI